MKYLLLLPTLIWASSAGAPLLAQETSFQETIEAEPYEMSARMGRSRFKDGMVIQLDEKDAEKFTFKKQASDLGAGSVAVQTNASKLWFFFSDDALAFVDCVVSSGYDVTGVDGQAVGLPKTDSISLTLTKHPQWKSLKVSPGAVMAVEGTGNAVADYTAIPFTDYCWVCFGGNSKDAYFGILAVSRDDGSAKWLECHRVGTGLRRDQAGAYRAVIRSQSNDAELNRAVQFGRLPLRAKRPVLTEIGERYVYGVIDKRDRLETRNTAYLLKDLGAIRTVTGYHAEAAKWNEKELALMKSQFSNDKVELLSAYVRLSGSLAKSGQFEAAKSVLVESMDLSGEVDNFNWTFMHQQTVGEVTFGLKNYASAVQIFSDLAAKAGEAKYKVNELQCRIFQATAQIAMGHPEEAKATLKQAIEIAQSDKKRFHDTFKIAFALAAAGDLETALKYAPASNNKNSVTYMEIARMAILYNLGRTDEAVKLATTFEKRLDEQANLRTDMDPIHVQMISALAKRTPEAISKLQEQWAIHGDTLRKQPLENWNSAVVFSQTMKLL